MFDEWSVSSGLASRVPLVDGNLFCQTADSWKKFSRFWCELHLRLRVRGTFVSLRETKSLCLEKGEKPTHLLLGFLRADLTQHD